jgi:hypothetical protein
VETNTNRNVVRFDPSAELYIYLEKGTHITFSQLAGFVQEAADKVEPWCNTRKQPFENFILVDDSTGTITPDGEYKFYVVKISTLGLLSLATLGLPQLFAYRSFIESIARSFLDLKVPGVNAVRGFVKYSLPLTLIEASSVA